MVKRPVILCVLDGWGYREQKEANAIALANTPVWDRWMATYPTCFLKTSGRDVGLPDGQMGNSEVGHTNLGAGRIVMQDLPRIDDAIATGKLAQNPVLLDLQAALKKTQGTCHLMGLLSDGGVHSHIHHFIALARLLGQAGIPVSVDAFLDGRETPPTSGLSYVPEFEKQTQDLPLIKIHMVSGRYYAMDRDHRWERVSLAYNALVNADAPRFETAEQAVEASYQAQVTDEFMKPVVIGDYAGMKDGDAILMVNFRSDRARELTEMLVNPTFDAAPRARVVSFADAVGMTEYSEAHKQWLHILFPAETLTHIFGEEVAAAGKTQLRIAETEKYAHVTFFFNGGEEKLFSQEERILIPSPKVATYDLQPEMSAYEVTDQLEKAILSEKFDAIIVNYANGDMVGHTGVLSAAIKAVEAVDSCLDRLEKAVQKVGGCMFVTADHGNAEMMVDPETNQPYTAHTTFPVKATLVCPPEWVKGLKDGRLADVAPTLLRLMDLPKPEQMTGQSLLIEG